MLSGSWRGCDSTAHDDAYWLESWQMDSGDVPLCMQSSGQPRHNPLIEETEQTFCDLNSNRVFFIFLEDRLILCSDVDSAMLDPNNRCQYFSTFNWSEHIRCMKKKKRHQMDLKRRFEKARTSAICVDWKHVEAVWPWIRKWVLKTTTSLQVFTQEKQACEWQVALFLSYLKLYINCGRLYLCASLNHGYTELLRVTLFRACCFQKSNSGGSGQ